MAVEEKIGGRLGSTRAALAWLLEYGTTMRSLFLVGADGRTCLQRRTGKRLRRPLAEWGQKVMFEVRPRRRPREGINQGKLEPRYDEGVHGPSGLGGVLGGEPEG